MVSDARSLCARNALRHSDKLSLAASMGEEEALPVTLPNLARGNLRIHSSPQGSHT